MISVMERRTGVPVSLAVLYVAVVRKAVWHAQPVETPGHVYVRLGRGAATALIDPFSAGALIATSPYGRQTGRTYVASGGVPMKLMSNRAILVRLVFNAAIRSEAAGDVLRAAQLFERASVVARRMLTLARSKALLGDMASARFDLAAVLGISFDGDRPVRPTAGRAASRRHAVDQGRQQ